MIKKLLTILLLAPLCVNAQWISGGTPQTILSGNKQLRFNFGASGFVYGYTKGQIDSLFGVGHGVTSFNGRTGSVVPLVGDYSAFYAPITGSTNYVPYTGATGGVNLGPYSLVTNWAQIAGGSGLGVGQIFSKFGNSSDYISTFNSDGSAAGTVGWKFINSGTNQLEMRYTGSGNRFTIYDGGGTLQGSIAYLSDITTAGAGYVKYTDTTSTIQTIQNLNPRIAAFGDPRYLKASSPKINNASQYFPLGDSFTLSAQATLPAYGYVSLFDVNNLGSITINNQALSGSGSYYAAQQDNANENIGNQNFTSAMFGFNDIKQFVSSTTNKITNGYTAIFANHNLDSLTAAGTTTARIVTTGTWTTGYNAATLGAGKTTNGITSSTSGNTISYTFYNDNVVLGMIGADGTLYNYGTFTVAIDGVSKGSYNLNGQTDGKTDINGNDNGRIPYVLMFAGLGQGTHVIVVTKTNSLPTPIDYFGQLKQAVNCTPFLVIQVPKLSAAGQVTFPLLTDANVNAVNAALTSIVASWPANYPVYTALTNSYYNTATGSGADNIHPNNNGYRQIYNACYAAIASLQNNSFILNNKSGVSQAGQVDVTGSGKFGNGLNVIGLSTFTATGATPVGIALIGAPMGIDNSKGYKAKNNAGTGYTTLITNTTADQVVVGANSEIVLSGSVIVQPPNGGSVTIAGGAVDGASAVGTVINTRNTLSTAGAKILSVRNVAAEKFYVDKDGVLGIPFYSTNGVLHSVSGVMTSSLLVNADVTPQSLNSTAIDTTSMATKLSILPTVLKRANTFTPLQGFSNGVNASSIFIGNANAFNTTTNASIYYSLNTGTGYPFGSGFANGTLVTQGRGNANTDIAFVTGSTPSVKGFISGATGNLNWGLNTGVDQGYGGSFNASGTNGYFKAGQLTVDASGIPNVPTAAPGTITTQAASAAFVKAAVSAGDSTQYVPKVNAATYTRTGALYQNGNFTMPSGATATLPQIVNIGPAGNNTLTSTAGYFDYNSPTGMRFIYSGVDKFDYLPSNGKWVASVPVQATILLATAPNVGTVGDSIVVHHTSNNQFQTIAASNYAKATPTTEITTTTSGSVQNRYVTNNTTRVILTLPATASQGDVVFVVGKGSGGWQVGQNAGQTIHGNASDTTTGTGGNLQSSSRYNCVELRCITANTDWVIVNSNGSLTTN